MVADLSAHASSGAPFEFPDRLPYVLDLLAGVRRQINEGLKSASPTVLAWWRSQLTPRRRAITEMRNAALKRLDQQVEEAGFFQVFSSDGTIKTTTTSLMGESTSQRTVPSGDVVRISTGWQFVGGIFNGEDVLRVVREELDDLAKLLVEAKRRAGE
ncbi:hypothetical protein FHX74_001670 [Friedmanniella endophytica]|uniref:Uncharacterized protein n=1 Tax=Microlunatus kandeliicorticis TaxID=1759536 RepID=A0A7W3IRY5_9ACTN|nr:hypothetical protein [Microlunatus kandeliicorticis]MBA8794065.1 hypothetical protein [Microlunatus kandeliicorticis]